MTLAPFLAFYRPVFRYKQTLMTKELATAMTTHTITFKG